MIASPSSREVALRRLEPPCRVHAVLPTGEDCRNRSEAHPSWKRGPPPRERHAAAVGLVENINDTPNAEKIIWQTHNC